MAVHLAASRNPILGVLAGVLVASIVGVGTLSLADIHVVPQEVRIEHRVRWNTRKFRSEYQQWRFMRINGKAWSNLGRALGQVSKPGDSMTMGAIGAAAYHSDLFIFDRYGLVTREVAERNASAGAHKSPGHDKSVPASFFLDKEPTYLWAKVLRGRRGLQRGTKSLDQWKRGAMSEDYGPRLQPVELEGTDAFLLTIRRVRKPAKAWSDLPKKVAEFVELTKDEGSEGSDTDEPGEP